MSEQREYTYFQREDYLGGSLGFSCKHRVLTLLINVSERGIYLNADRVWLSPEEQAEFVEVMRECVAEYDAIQREGRTPSEDFRVWQASRYADDPPARDESAQS